MRPTIPVGKRTSRFRLPLTKRRAEGQQAFRPTGNQLSDPEKHLRTIIEQMFAEIPPADIPAEPTNSDLANYNRQTLAHFVRYNSRLVQVLEDQYLASAQLAAREIALIVSRGFAKIGKAETPLPSEMIASWGLGDDLPRAQEWAQAEAGNLITNMTREQQQTFRRVVDQSYSLGRTPSSTARPLIDALNEVEPSSTTAQAVRNLFGTNMNGLTARYEQAVVNRATKLASTLEGRGVSADKIIERVGKDTEKYANKLRRSRANTISRTEILRANNEGRLAGFQEATRQGVLSSEYARKSWTVSPMDVCDICVPLDGQLQPLDQPFTNGTMTPPAHPNCRCSFDIEPNVELYEPPQVLGTGTPEDPFRVGDIGDFTSTGQDYAARPLISGQPRGLPGEIIATPADYDAAQTLFDQATSLEPRITTTVTDQAGRFRGELTGLEFRRKTLDSLAEKIAKDRVGNGLTAIETAGKIKDSVRYTVLLEPSEYGLQAQNMIDELRASGKRVTVKNTWRRGSEYNGINAQVFDPDLDQWYEIQFHTDASFDVKQGIHEIYEERRKVTDPIVQKRLDMEMIEISGTQRFPVGASIVKRR